MVDQLIEKIDQTIVRTDEMRHFLRLLFDESDLVSFGILNTTKARQYRSLERLIETASAPPFVCINPLTIVDHEWDQKQGRSYLRPRRADVNVSRFRSFLFEMDTVNLTDQLTILQKCAIPFTSLIYSGGKSVHAILSLESPLEGCHTHNGIQAYKDVWRRLEAHIQRTADRLGFVGRVVDPSSKNPSRLSRCAGGIEYNRKRQTILHLSPARLSLSDFNHLLAECPEVAAPIESYYNPSNPESMDEFFRTAPEGLTNTIKYPTWIAKSGNYPHLYRIAKWAKDATGVSAEVLTDIFGKYVYPRLERLGYRAQRAQLGINHAYGVRLRAGGNRE